MQDSKLFQLLQTLNIYELNRFGKFLRSGYFNEDERLIQLYEMLLPHFKQQSHQALKQRQVWKAVHDKKKFHALKFARLFSDLLKKAEEFLVVDQIKQNESQKLNRLLAHYTERKLARHYPDASKLARKKLDASAQRDGDYYYALFQLESQQNTFLELQNQRSTEKNLLETNDALDTFYLINKLDYLAALLHYKNFLSLEGEMKLAREVLAHLKKHNYKHLPAIDIRYRVVLSLLEPKKEEHFIALKSSLAQHHQLFAKTNARNLYAFAINYCIRKINSGKLAYVAELFALYKQMLEADLLSDEAGMLSQFDYKNIVTVALRAQEVSWTAKFIHDYKKRLHPDQRQNAYTFNLARLYFHQKKFDKVLPLLQDVDYTDIFYQLDSKTTLMKTYYELGEYLPLMSLKESFRIMLRRKKLISEQNRINYMNFIRFTMKLYRIDVKQSEKLNALRKAILASNNVADKTWLVEKLNELGA